MSNSGPCTASAIKSMAESGIALEGNVGDFDIKGNASGKVIPKLFGFLQTLVGLLRYFYANHEHGSTYPEVLPSSLPQLGIALLFPVCSSVPTQP
jgi:hypothetical protein